MMAQVPVDPLNNMTGDASPPGTYAYRYYCYPNGSYPGLVLYYWSESGGWTTVHKNIANTAGGTDSTFICS